MSRALATSRDAQVRGDRLSCDMLLRARVALALLSRVYRVCERFERLALRASRAACVDVANTLSDALHRAALRAQFVVRWVLAVDLFGAWR